MRSHASAQWTKYAHSARFYDLISAEWPVYRAGRVRGVAMAGIRRGDHVVDIGCGTGLNLPLLRGAVGPSGHITGLDLSPQMLTQARRRVRRNGWDNVTLIRGDAAAATLDGLPDRADVVLATYVVSLVADRARVVDRMLTIAAPGGTVCIVDMQDPTGAARIATPLARIACRMGGSDITAHPWTILEDRADEVRAAQVRGGHIQIRVGRAPA